MEDPTSSAILSNCFLNFAARHLVAELQIREIFKDIGLLERREMALLMFFMVLQQKSIVV
jgi:hypothetical protein